jgi:tetratricopeptide (TPR) repeat protein
MSRKRYLSLLFVFFIGGASAAMAADSVSALLEKGIYSEETVGDLPKAIEIYQKVVDEAKTSEAYAAEAQYRLGQCLLKQKKNDEATAAFKKLIESYPNQKEWIAKANKLIPGQAELKLEEVPWKEGDYMQMVVKLGGGMKIGTFIFSIESAKLDGKDIWRAKTHRFILAGGDNRGYSQVDADKKTFAPITSVFDHTLLGDTDAKYSPDEVDVKSMKNGKVVSSRKEDLNKLYYDNEQGVEVFRRLPLANGYKCTVPIYVPFGGGKLDLPIEITGKETVEVPAGKFECYKMQLGIVNQTFWISTDANRYFVKLEAGGVVGELTSTGIITPDQKKSTYANEKSGLSLTVPSGWYFYEQDMPGEKNLDIVFLLDPQVTGTNTISVAKATNNDAKDVKADSKKALKDWADESVAVKSKELKDMKIRPDSWQYRTVGGLPAVSFISDYTIDQQKKSSYAVFVMGQTTKAELMITLCDPDKLDALRAEFDKIVETLKIK